MFKGILKEQTIQVGIGFVFIVVLLGTFILPEWMSNNFMYGLSRGLAVLGLMILWRTNLVSFGHALYYGFGAYAVAMAQKYLGVTDVFLRIIIAIAAAGLLGFVLGFILRRYREIFFAMLSLAFSMVLYGLLAKAEFLGSTDGMSISPSTMFGFELGRFGLFYFIGFVVILSLIFAQSIQAFPIQDDMEMMEQDSVQTTDVVEMEEPVMEEPVEEEQLNFHQELKKRFIEGGPGFMGIVLLCLILGLAIAIERIIYLNLSTTTDSSKLTSDVEAAMKSGGVNAAKEVCRNTPGPVASIFYQGLDRSSEGIESAEKAVIAYGGVQMGQLEKNVSWISLFIALAPMLGFMGTVIGMIQAFDKIEAAGDMQPSLVAGGIKVALLTTVFGLIVAIILQIFYNYIIAKIDSIVNDMENASIDLMDILVNNKK